MRGHSRPKDGVASLAYDPRISLRFARCPPKRDGREVFSPAMTTVEYLHVTARSRTGAACQHAVISAALANWPKNASMFSKVISCAA